MAKTRKPPPPPPPPPPLPPPPAETPSPRRRRKKKGRPSLLDLQRRSLRLQAQNPSPAPSPTRRDPNPSDDDDDGTGSGRRRQKRLKSVLSGVVKEEPGEGKKDAAKATGKGDAASDGGPTGTPLPDKKLLLFILDRLQKKDAYGVFSEPVDAEELPDYFDIIEHPMDFSTIREKLLNDSYSKLEQFEDDVFLLTSNAMSYNSADTVYFRQARSIEALAKKDFENLRQPSDEEEEPKPPARRGRPPKNPKTEGDVSPDLSNVKANKPEDSADTSRKRSTGDRTRNTNAPMKEPSSFHNMLGSFSAKRTDKISDFSGSSKWGKKPVSLDDDRRSTYDQHYSRNSSLFAALDDERKVLVPVGVQQQHAYARSLARFASKLGPVGWDVAASRIRRALPPGTSFGPGWVVDGEPTQNSQWAPVAPTNRPSESTAPPNMPSKNDVHHKSGASSNGDVGGEEHLTRTQTVASTSAGIDKGSEIPSKVIKYENGVKSCGGMDNTGSAAPPMQQDIHSRQMQSNINGFTAMSNAMSQYAGQGLFGSGIPMTHAQVLGMFSGMNGKVNGYMHRHPVTADSLKTAPQNGDVGKAIVNPVQGAGHDPKVANDNSSAHPGLNSDVQSSGSPPRGKLASPKHPDLALQL